MKENLLSFPITPVVAVFGQLFKESYPFEVAHANWKKGQHAVNIDFCTCLFFGFFYFVGIYFVIDVRSFLDWARVLIYTGLKFNQI